MTQKQSQYLLYALIVILVLSLFHRLELLHLKFEEPRRALVSLEMVKTGDWLHPTIYGLPYYNKPPLYNWMLGGLQLLFGFADWVIRIPTVLSLLFIGLIHTWFFRLKIGLEKALWSALFFVSSVNIYLYFSFQGEMDMVYTLIVYSQILIIFHYFEKQKYWPLFLISYFLTALGFLTKGLPSIGFQGLTLIGLMIYYRKFKWFFSLPHVVSGLLSVLLMASYFIIYDATGGQSEYYLAKLFFEGARRTVDHSSDFPFVKAFLRFLPLMIYLLSPWSVISGWGIHRSVIKKQYENKWLQFALVFLLFNLPLYWLSAGTRDRYLYMFLPFAFLWIVEWVWVAVDKKSMRLITAGFFGILGLVAFGFLFTSYTQFPSGWWALTTAGVGFLILTGLVYRYNLPLLHGWLIALIGFRFIFNTLIFDIRKSEEITVDYPQIVVSILTAVNDHQVYYYTPLQHEEDVLPITQEGLYFPCITRLDYTFTYYFDRQAKDPIQYIEFFTGGQFVIMEATLHVNKTHQLLKEFKLNGTDYVLVKT